MLAIIYYGAYSVYITDQPNEKVINWDLIYRKLKGALKPIIYLIRLLIILIFVSLLLLLNKYLISSSRVNNENVISYLTALKWPITLAVFYLIFRAHLPDLIRRMTEVSRSGVKFAGPQPIPASPELADVSESSSGTNTDRFDITTDEGRTNVLQNVEVKYELEKIYRIIFGTQIEALLTLVSYPDGLKSQDLENLYQKHKQLFPTSPYNSTLELLRYPSGNHLIEYDNQTSIYKITDIGRLFLDYLGSEDLLNTIARPN